MTDYNNKPSGSIHSRDVSPTKSVRSYATRDTPLSIASDVRSLSVQAGSHTNHFQDHGESSPFEEVFHSREVLSESTNMSQYAHQAIQRLPDQPRYFEQPRAELGVEMPENPFATMERTVNSDIEVIPGPRDDPFLIEHHSPLPRQPSFDPLTIEKELLTPETEWQPCHTETGETYYWNARTGETSWEIPNSLPRPPADQTSRQREKSIAPDNGYTSDSNPFSSAPNLSQDNHVLVLEDVRYVLNPVGFTVY